MAQVLTPAHVQFLMDNGLRRVLRKDDTLPHQVRTALTPGAQHILISCTCLRSPGGSYQPIESRAFWQPREAIAAWQEHVADAEAAIA